MKLRWLRPLLLLAALLPCGCRHWWERECTPCCPTAYPAYTPAPAYGQPCPPGCLPAASCQPVTTVPGRVGP